MNKIKGFFTKGMFRNYYIGDLIENKQDYDAFLGFYMSRVGGLMTASLLGMNLKVNDNQIIAENSKGETCTLGFAFNSTKELYNGEAFQSDIDSVVAFENFLIQDLKEKVGSEIDDMQYLEHAEYVIYKILNANINEDDFSRDKVKSLITSARAQLANLRRFGTSLDLDNVAGASQASLEYLARNLPARGDFRYNFNRIRSFQPVALGSQIEKSIQIRGAEIAMNSLDRNKASENSSFWDYYLQKRRIQAHPEMW